MSITNKQKGTIIENLVVELITFGSNGALTCYTPNADDDGVDIILNQKGDINPLFVQVKSRFSLEKNGRYAHNIGVNTCKNHELLYYLFLLYNQLERDIQCVWVVPSRDLFKNIKVSEISGRQNHLRFGANPFSDKDKWAHYRVEPNEIGSYFLKQLVM